MSSLNLNGLRSRLGSSSFLFSHTGVESLDKQKSIQIVRDYLNAVMQGDLDNIVALFTDNGYVYTPLQGRKLPPAEFFSMLFEASAEVKINLIDVFTSAEDSGRIAGYFNYAWGLPNGEQVSFDATDIFEISPEDQKIRSIVAIYDTHVLRGIGEEYKVTESSRELKGTSAPL